MFFGPLVQTYQGNYGMEAIGNTGVPSKAFIAGTVADVLIFLATFLIGVMAADKLNLSQLVQYSFVIGGSLATLSNFMQLLVLARTRLSVTMKSKEEGQLD